MQDLTRKDIEDAKQRLLEYRPPKPIADCAKCGKPVFLAVWWGKKIYHPHCHLAEVLGETEC